MRLTSATRQRPPATKCVLGIVLKMCLSPCVDPLGHSFPGTKQVMRVSGCDESKRISHTFAGTNWCESHTSNGVVRVLLQVHFKYPVSNGTHLCWYSTHACVFASLRRDITAVGGTQGRRREGKYRTAAPCKSSTRNAAAQGFVSRDKTFELCTVSCQGAGRVVGLLIRPRARHNTQLLKARTARTTKQNFCLYSSLLLNVIRWSRESFLLHRAALAQQASRATKKRHIGRSKLSFGQAPSSSESVMSHLSAYRASLSPISVQLFTPFRRRHK